MALLEKITQEELEFYETLCLPDAFAEIMFSDFDNLQLFTKKFGHIRNGQLSMLSFEYLIDDEDQNLSIKENFKMLEGAGTVHNYGSRKIGKTLVGLIMDMFQSSWFHPGWEVLYSSYDYLHILGVLDKMVFGFKNHPLFKSFFSTAQKTPNYIVNFRNGFSIVGINQNVMAKDPGGQFFSRHTKKHFMDESSKETLKVKQKRIDAVSELGCIERFSGMTDMSLHSPAGEVFYDSKMKPWLYNVPQYISPLWDEKEKVNAIDKYHGEGSIGYRIFVKGEVVTEGETLFDMARVEKCVNRNKQIKVFEVSKDDFHYFKERVIVERPKGASNIWIAADIGLSAPTEIAVVAQMNKKYHYLYNITLHNLTHKEQHLVFKWLGEELKANFIALDCTDGTGRAIYRELEESFPKSNLSWVSFNEKIPVDFETDDNGHMILKDGKPVERMEYCSEWSVQHFKDLIYGERMVFPVDFKLEKQISGMKSMRSGNRIKYQCIDGEDHLFQAFQVFSISQWFNEFNLNKPIRTKTFDKFGC